MSSDGADTKDSKPQTPTATDVPAPATHDTDAGGFNFPDTGADDAASATDAAPSCVPLAAAFDGGAGLNDESVAEGVTRTYCANVPKASYRVEVYEEDLSENSCARVTLEVTAPDGKDTRKSELDTRNSIFFLNAAAGVYRIKVTGRKPGTPCADSPFRIAYAIR
jgi:hypothetical protein